MLLQRWGRLQRRLALGGDRVAGALRSLIRLRHDTEGAGPIITPEPEPALVSRKPHVQFRKARVRERVASVWREDRRVPVSFFAQLAVRVHYRPGGEATSEGFSGRCPSEELRVKSRRQAVADPSPRPEVRRT